MEAALAQKRRVRSPVCAGIFYPDDKKEMLEYLESFGFEEGKGGHAQAIIAPHAAWSYSGTLIAGAFSSVMGRSSRVKKIVILGPIHDKREKGIFLSNSYSFFTPLGNIHVDKEITEELEFHGKFFEINDIPHLSEHSIEILLPFIKFCFPDASIVPVLMGQPEACHILDLAHALKTAISPVLSETLIIVSCNLSCDADKANARILAEQTVSLFTEKNPRNLSSAVLNGRLNACGGALVAALFESGLLDKTHTCSVADNLVSAVGAENDTVFYSEFAYA